MVAKEKTKSITDRLVQHKLKFDRRKSASIVKVEIENELGISLHVDTIRKRAHEVGLFERVSRKKPYVNKSNPGKRLKFGKKMLEKPMDFWKNVVWSDESKFNLLGSDGKVVVWKTLHEEFVQYLRSNAAVVWSCFIRQRIGKLCLLDDIMNRFYCRDILEQNLQSSINHVRLDQRCIFMHVIMILNIPQD